MVDDKPENYATAFGNDISNKDMSSSVLPPSRTENTVAEEETLPQALRKFAERAPMCWEGNDVDAAAKAMLGAADLLDAQDEYDQNPELQDTLKHSAESETVVRNRKTAKEN